MNEMNSSKRKLMMALSSAVWAFGLMATSARAIGSEAPRGFYAKVAWHF